MKKIKNSEFVHCHTHTEYSAFDGLASVDDMVTTARKMGFPALAITDHGNIGGIIPFINACTASKDKDGNDIIEPTIKPLVGIECYMSRDASAHSKVEQPEGRRGNYHLILIAKNFKGYQNLCRLSHKSWTSGFYMKPRIDFELLSEHSEGLICSTACLAGLVNAELIRDRYDAAKMFAGAFKDIFGEDFFMEVMYHGISLQKEIIPELFSIASDLDVPLIATNDIHYLRRDQASSHELFMCMSTNRCIKAKNRIRFPFPEFYLKSAEEMLSMFSSAPWLLQNTLSLAERVDFVDIQKNLFGGMRLPVFDLPEGETSLSHLRKLALDGAKRLGWDKSEKHMKALKIELDDIEIALVNNNYDFATYFLMVEDITRFARESGILGGPGRGSGYGSLLLRCLGVTYGPDPLDFGLLWQRFLGFDTFRFILEKDFGIND